MSPPPKTADFVSNFFLKSKIPICSFFTELYASLRKFKIVIMKLDNLVTKHLKNVKPEAGMEENKEKPSLFEKKENNS